MPKSEGDHINNTKLGFRSRFHNTSLFLLQFRQWGKYIFHLKEQNSSIVFKVSDDSWVTYEDFAFKLFSFGSLMLKYFSEH